MTDNQEDEVRIALDRALMMYGSNGRVSIEAQPVRDLLDEHADCHPDEDFAALEKERDEAQEKLNEVEEELEELKSKRTEQDETIAQLRSCLVLLGAMVKVAQTHPEQPMQWLNEAKDAMEHARGALGELSKEEKTILERGVKSASGRNGEGSGKAARSSGGAGKAGNPPRRS